MKKQTQGKIAGILLSLFSTQCGALTEYGFDNLTTTFQYTVGDIWITNVDWQFEMRGFELPDLSTDMNGYGQADNDLNAGGFIREMGLFDILLEIDTNGNHNKPNVGLSFLFGEYGGNVNFEVNGDFINTADFSDLDGTVLGGAALSVAFNPSTNMGRVFVDGAVETFAVGGQNLYIDSVGPIPIPAAVWLFGSALLCLVGITRRSRLSQSRILG